jgi:hypothetical protein
MPASFLIGLLLASGPAPDVAVAPQPGGRLRLTALANSDSPESLARAMIGLREEAARQCHGRGRPVSEGTLEANQVPGRRGRLALSEIYSCVPSPAH